MATTEYIIIEVPDKNDSVSRVVLNSAVYYIRFTWNDSYEYWKFGIYNDQREPIVIGIKIVPNFPLNVYYGVTDLPKGAFIVKTSLDHERVGRDDFKDELAQFIFLPVEYSG